MTEEVAAAYLSRNCKTHRYRDLLIVCNVQASSGPVDLEGLYYHVNGAASRIMGMPSISENSEQGPKTLEDCENKMDATSSRAGVVRSNTNPKCKNKVGQCFSCVSESVCVRVCFNHIN
jgi:hypothetical protein